MSKVPRNNKAKPKTSSLKKVRTLGAPHGQAATPRKSPFKKRDGWQPPKKVSSRAPRQSKASRKRKEIVKFSRSEALANTPAPKKFLPKAHQHSAALAAVLPLQYSTRFVAGWSNQPTATANPWTTSSVDFTQTPPEGSMLGGGGFWCAVSRDPLNAIMEYYPNFQKLKFRYLAYFNAISTAGYPSILNAYAPPATISDRWWVPMAKFVDTAIGDPLFAHPHGNVFFPKQTRSGDKKFIYLGTSESVKLFCFNALMVAHAITNTFEIYRYDGSTETIYQVQDTATASTFVFTATQPGYYAFSCLVTDLGTLNAFKYIQMIYGAGTDSLPESPPSLISHRPMPGLADRYSVNAIRINGVSLMVTPDGVQATKGGTIVGAQVEPNALPEGFVSNCGGASVLDLLGNAPNPDNRTFAKGGYAFHKPCTNTAYDIRTVFKYNNSYTPTALGTPQSSAIADFVSYIDDQDGWLMYGVQVPTSDDTFGNSPYPGGLCHVTYAFSIEYRCTDVWVGRAMPQGGPSEYDELMSLVSRAPQFHENPLHISDLKRWYNHASPYVRTLAPSLLAILSRFGPQGAAIATALGAAGRILPNRWT